MIYAPNPYEHREPRTSVHDADWYRDDALASGDDLNPSA